MQFQGNLILYAATRLIIHQQGEKTPQSSKPLGNSQRLFLLRKPTSK